MKMKAISTFFFFCLLLVAGYVQAQDRTIKGTITEAGKTATMPGVSIVVKQNPSIGTVSDFDGNYFIKIPSSIDNPILLFTFIGYKDVEVVVGSQTVINIAMAEAVTDLKEVVITDSYSPPVKNIQVNTAISTIKGESLGKLPVASFDAGLVGRAPGLDVSGSGSVPGAPTRMQIRGTGSISSGTEPLIIVDGMPISSAIAGQDVTPGGGGAPPVNPLAFLNSNDIETFTILKDAAAVAKYGARGANGVILVTTKSGKKGVATTTVDFNTGVTMPVNLVKYADANEWLSYADRGVRNSPMSTIRSQGYYEPSLYNNFSALAGNPLQFNYNFSKAEIERFGINTNWLKDHALRSSGDFKDFNISTNKGFVNGGGMYLSAQYRTENGVFPNNRLDRYQTRLNVNYPINDRMNTSVKFNFSYQKNDRPSIDRGFTNAITDALPFQPVYGPIRNADGSVARNDDGSLKGLGNSTSDFYNVASGNNVAANVNSDLYRNTYSEFRTVGTAQLTYKIIKGLSVTGSGSIDHTSGKNTQYISPLFVSGGDLVTDPRPFSGASRPYTTGIYDGRVVANFNGFISLNYNRDFGENNKHSVSGLLVAEQQMKSTRRTGVTIRNGANADGYQPGTIDGTLNGLPYGNTPGAASNGAFINLPQTGSVISTGYFPDVFFEGVALAVDYRFDNRYMVGASVRRDGSSNFGTENRYGWFPAISGGWLISDEKFIEPLDFISLLKLKGSFGITGNADIPGNAKNTTYNSPQSPFTPSPLFLNELGNPALKWERSSTFDFALDYGFFKNRFQGSVGYYNRTTQDMLFNVAAPPSLGIAGINNYWANIGSMRNWGWEFTIDAKVFEIKQAGTNDVKFSWNTSFNLTTNDNKIIELTPNIPGTDPRLGFAYNVNGSPITYSTQGRRLGAYYVAEYAGLNEQGLEMIYEINQDVLRNTGEFVKTGNVVRATAQNVLNNAIRQDNKTNTPRWYGGWTNSFKYQSFELSVQFTFRGGFYIYDFNQMQTSYINSGSNVIRKDALDTWTPENPNAPYPVVSFSQAQGIDADGQTIMQGLNDGHRTDRFLHRGDFISLRNIQFSYTLPAKMCQTIKLKSIKAYINAQNLFYFSNYPGFTPELVVFSDNRVDRNLGQSIAGQGSVLPQVIAINAGLSISF
jgi:TonB-linked SusC/RagA family outer membrane protein